MKKSEQRWRNIWGIIKQINICFMDIPEGEMRKKEAEIIWRNNDEGLHKFEEIHGSTSPRNSRIPNRIKPKRLQQNTLKSNCQKKRQGILKAAREKWFIIARDAQ